MERVEGGPFRNGLCKAEMVVPKKSNQNLFGEDFWSVNCQNGDDFSVDDLLDFSKHDIIEQFPEEKQEIPQTENPSANEQPPEKAMARTGLTVSCEEFHVPVGDLDDLEWLSNFVDDSFAGYSLTYPTGKLPEKPGAELQQQPPAPDVKPSFTSLVQTKARSKRVRTEGRVWSIGSGSLQESSTNSSSSSSSTSFPPNSNPQSQTSDSLILLPPPPAKKQRKKKKPENATPVLCGFQPAARRCSHCLVQKTPQWRAGPLGAKTLCNACGVRYKSGRLLPEYRPACSPTFSTELHSNNHRKVLEMRQKKAVVVEADIVPPPVPSF